MARARRPAARSERSFALALVFSLCLAGLGPCLCEREPARTPDAHACCTPAAKPTVRAPVGETIVSATFAPCCTARAGAAVAEAVEGRAVGGAASIGPATFRGAPDAPVASFTAVATTAVAGMSPPQRSRILRI